MAPPLVVYLDTQDYSRFGDVLRGKSNSETEALFRKLENYRAEGDVIFPISMPILGELLQYDAQHRETTFKKAEAVERLCGRWALPYPSRLMAAEIAIVARCLGLIQKTSSIDILSDERYWYPNISDIFENFRDTLLQAAKTEIAGLGSRSDRRRTAKQVRKMDFLKAAQNAAPQIAARYQIPIIAITNSIVSFLNGSITSYEASRNLFSYISEPVAFVSTYFENIESDRTLPQWVGGFGRELSNTLEDLRQQLRPLMDAGAQPNEVRAMFAKLSLQMGRRMIRIAYNNVSEFGVDNALFDRFNNETKLADRIKSCTVIGEIVGGYANCVTGLSGGREAKIERGFGGDLMHALYLPHVDLWRADRNFSEIIKNTLPNYASRVVNTVTALPAQIEALQMRGAT